jgi:hypothetical protein
MWYATVIVLVSSPLICACLAAYLDSRPLVALCAAYHGLNRKWIDDLLRIQVQSPHRRYNERWLADH